MNSPSLLIRNVTVNGATRRNVLIRGNRVAGLGREMAHATRVIDGNGGRLLPGLIDHHIHLLAAASALTSFDVGAAPGGDAVPFEDRIRQLAAVGPVRVIGYSDDTRPILNRWDLDALAGPVPVRVQYRTGSLWVLNTAALDLVKSANADAPAEFERDGLGQLNGRVWRGDHHLRIDRTAVESLLTRLGMALSRWGVTGVTDASATTSQQQAGFIARAAQEFPQRLCLMSASTLGAGAGTGFSVGPVKILLDEHALPDLDDVIQTIRFARSEHRRVAAHCVTPAELALMIAAFQAAGPLAGDRIEHGSMIPGAAMAPLAELGVTVVTQPAFVFARGDRYLRTIPAGEHQDLYRLRSLLQTGLRVVAGSDAPYGPVNPWTAIRAAMERRTRDGIVLGESERVDVDTAIGLYMPMIECQHLYEPAIRVGMLADLCLLKAGISWPDEDPVALTLIDGKIAYLRGSTAKSGNLSAHRDAVAPECTTLGQDSD